MTSLRIATFNVENLFTTPPSEVPVQERDRRFGAFLFDSPEEALQVRRTVGAALSDDDRQLTAQALIDTEADVVCLQEVESQKALELFRDNFLHRALRARVAVDLKQAHGPVNARLAAGEITQEQARDEMTEAQRASEARHYYRHALVAKGNDGRGINVGCLSKLRIAHQQSHALLRFSDVPGAWTRELESTLVRAWEKDGKAAGKPRPSADDRVFRRDCLRVDVEKDGARLALFICHFKANPPFRARTHPIRVAEARAVRHVVSTAFGAGFRDADWVICGDLNDYTDIDGDARMPDLVSGGWQPTAMSELLGGDEPFGVDACAAIDDPTDRWTFYYQDDDIYCQLDHIILSPALAARNAGARPDINRRGLPYRAGRHERPRYPRIGWDRPKASDHCPIAITLELG